MTSTRLAIPFLPGPPLVNLGSQRSELVAGYGLGICKDIRDRGSAERVHHAVNHRSHRFSVGPPFLEAVEHLLLALLPHRDKILVDKSIQGRRDARVRDVPGLLDLLV